MTLSVQREMRQVPFGRVECALEDLRSTHYHMIGRFKSFSDPKEPYARDMQFGSLRREDFVAKKYELQRLHGEVYWHIGTILMDLDQQKAGRCREIVNEAVSRLVDCEERILRESTLAIANAVSREQVDVMTAEEFGRTGKVMEQFRCLVDLLAPSRPFTTDKFNAMAERILGAGSGPALQELASRQYSHSDVVQPKAVEAEEQIPVHSAPAEPARRGDLYLLPVIREEPRTDDGTQAGDTARQYAGRSAGQSVRGLANSAFFRAASMSVAAFESAAMAAKGIQAAAAAVRHEAPAVRGHDAVATVAEKRHGRIGLAGAALGAVAFAGAVAGHSYLKKHRRKSG